MDINFDELDTVSVSSTTSPIVYERKALSLKKSVNRNLRIGTKRTTKPSRVFKVEEGIVHNLLELPNGTLAMAGIKHCRICIFDFISGTLLKELVGHNDSITEMKSKFNLNQVTFTGQK